MRAAASFLSEWYKPDDPILRGHHVMFYSWRSYSPRLPCMHQRRHVSSKIEEKSGRLSSETYLLVRSKKHHLLLQCTSGDRADLVCHIQSKRVCVCVCMCASRRRTALCTPMSHTWRTDSALICSSQKDTGSAVTSIYQYFLFFNCLHLLPEQFQHAGDIS